MSVAYWMILGKCFQCINWTPEAITAAATIALAFLTLVLAVSTIALWMSTRGQLALARNEFSATHRPRLRVRRVYFDGFSETEILPAFITVVNVGEGRATVEGVSGEFCRMEDFRWLAGRPDITPRGRPPEPVFDTGELRTWMITSSEPLAPGAANLIRTNAQQLWIVGEIRYRDDANILRQTGFAWVYSRRWLDFEVAEDRTDYNFED